MERLHFSFDGGTASAGARPRIVGVVASGNLEVLIEPAPEEGGCRIDINTADRLHVAITYWGEELVRLRCSQSAGLRMDVLTDRRNEVDRLLSDIVIP